jgi:hypothetical protein
VLGGGSLDAKGLSAEELYDQKLKPALEKFWKNKGDGRKLNFER